MWYGNIEDHAYSSNITDNFHKMSVQKLEYHISSFMKITLYLNILKNDSIYKIIKNHIVICR